MLGLGAYVVDVELGLGVGLAGPLEGPLDVVLTKGSVEDGVSVGSIVVED